MKKYALIGTSCSGKTTLAYRICAELKQRGVVVDGVYQQDRRVPFSPEKLEETVNAQYWFVLNQMCSELVFEVENGPDVLVSDRSVVDFYAYLIQGFEDDIGLIELVREWVDTYDALYYLPPLEFEEKDRMVDDEFRMSVDKSLLWLIDEYDRISDVVRFMDREAICSDIFEDLNGSSKGKPIHEYELEKLPVYLEEDEVLVIGSYGSGGWLPGSDIDVYVKDLSAQRPSIDVTSEIMLERVYELDIDVTSVSVDEYQRLKNEPDAVVIQNDD